MQFTVIIRNRVALLVHFKVIMRSRGACPFRLLMRHRGACAVPYSYNKRGHIQLINSHEIQGSYTHDAQGACAVTHRAHTQFRVS